MKTGLEERMAATERKGERGRWSTSGVTADIVISNYVDSVWPAPALISLRLVTGYAGFYIHTQPAGIRIQPNSAWIRLPISGCSRILHGSRYRSRRNIIG
jgi:hypothetical protein